MLETDNMELFKQLLLFIKNTKFAVLNCISNWFHDFWLAPPNKDIGKIHVGRLQM